MIMFASYTMISYYSLEVVYVSYILFIILSVHKFPLHMVLLTALYYGLLQQSSSSLINNTILKILEQACGLVVG